MVLHKLQNDGMGLFKQISLQQLWRGAVTTLLAYPLVLLAAVTGTAAGVTLAELSFEQRQRSLYLEKLMLVSSLGLILFFTLELLVRKYKLDRKSVV